MTSTEAGNYELASYEYGENNGKLKKITYSNGLIVEYYYNALEKPKKVWYTENGTRTLAYEYEYTADINIHSNGSVEAPRPWLNWVALIMFGGEYE